MNKFMRPAVIRQLVLFALKSHNMAYYMSSILSKYHEPNRLHPKHRIIDYHQWFIEHVDNDWSILDVGCGNGALTTDLIRKCRAVTGIDINPNNISEAKVRTKDAKFIYGDASTYDFGQRFDAIVLSNVLEHIGNRLSFLSKLSRLSDRFLIRVPMVDRDWITLYKREFGIEYRLDSTHFIEYTFKQFEDEMSQAGLRIASYRIRYGELYAVCVKSNSAL